MFMIFFIVLLLLLCHVVTVMPVSAYTALAFVFGFIQINWWWWQKHKKTMWPWPL